MLTEAHAALDGRFDLRDSRSYVDLGPGGELRYTFRPRPVEAASGQPVGARDYTLRAMGRGVGCLSASLLRGRGEAVAEERLGELCFRGGGHADEYDGARWREESLQTPGQPPAHGALSQLRPERHVLILRPTGGSAVQLDALRLDLQDVALLSRDRR